MTALEGIKIIDLTHSGPGDFCTTMLGDFGGEVIKIQALPNSSGRASYVEYEMTKNYVHNPLNRNKKSLGLNLRADWGREIFYRLCREADVVIESFRPGTVKKLAVDYETVRRINPMIIYCSLSGYGQSGPYSNLPGHDVNFIGMGGVLDLVGEMGGPPVIPLNLIGDFAGAALHGVIGILTALVSRDRIGKGQYVDVAYLDSTISLLSFFLGPYFASGTVIKRGETALHGAYPYYGIYKTGDNKYLTIGCLETHFWRSLCQVLGTEEYVDDHLLPEHFFSAPEGARWKEIRSALEKVFLTGTRDEWFEKLSEHGIPVGKVCTPDEAIHDPQIQHRKMIIDIDHPEFGKVKQIGSAIQFSETPAKAKNSVAHFGEHSKEILHELGYSRKEIESFYQSSIVG